MKQLQRYISTLLHKLRSLYYSTDEIIYRLQVGDCYYSEARQEYMVVLHTTGKRGSFKMSVREIIANKRLLSQIHPVQASSLGWMAREAHYKFAANDNQYHHKNVS